MSVAAVQRRRRRLWMLLGRFGWISLGLLLPWLGTELALRLLGPILPGEYSTTEVYAYSPRYLYQNRPNAAGWVKNREYTTWIRVNSQGLRGPERPYAHPTDTFRIMVLGDSFTFAMQVAEVNTMTAQLEQLLNQRSFSKPVETINAGTDGWNTVNESDWLADEGFKYEPDLVLLMFYAGNDPIRNARDLKMIQEGRSRTRPGGRPPFEELRIPLRHASWAFHIFEWNVLARFVLGVPEELDDDPSGENQVERLEGWAASEMVIRQLRDACVARHQQLVLVGIPSIYHLLNTRTRTLPTREIAEQLDLPYIELLDVFRDQPERVQRQLYLPRDKHWTAAGHALSAQVIADHLSEHGLVSPAD